MATWKRSTSEPLTNESRVRVYDVANPEREGYVRVSWIKKYPSDTPPHFYGPVTRDVEFDADGRPTKTETLDREPTFE